MAEAPTPVEKTSTRRHLQEVLRLEDARSLKGSLGQMLKGIGWCLVAGIVFATVLYFGLSALFGTTFIGWFGWLGVFLLVLTIFLVVKARQNQKKPNYLVRSLSDDTPGDAVTDAEAYHPLYAQLLFWAPRAILDGVDVMRGKPSERKSALYKRTARIVIELGRWSGGVPIKALMRPPENMPLFADALDWLDQHDYTGKSSDGERIWITTIGRRKLAENNITIKVTEVS